MSAAEEWADADFDIPDDHPIAGNGHGWEAPAAIVLRPPLVIDDDDDEEGVSTIKVDQATLRQTQPLPLTTKAPEHDDTDDFEDGFALPDDLTQLSLAPITLSHRASRESWGEKDQTCSSQSSDAYSTLGLADGASSSSATSASIGSTDDDEDSCDDDLDGLVIPAAVFDHNAAKHLKKTLELRQRPPLPALGSTSQDDFEQDLIIDDEVDLSPSRLLHGTHRQRSLFARSSSLPEKKPSLPHRPPSRLLKSERAKSPNNPPPSASSRQLNKLRLSPSPPLLRPSSRTQSFQAALNSPNGPSGKSSSLRGQKSHSGLKPPSPSSSTRGLRRKASLSSLMETSSQAIPPPPTAPAQNARYDAPTAASRARHKASSTRLASKEYIVPPTRPSTPATNTAALRLTLPTQGRLSKSRPALATVFGATAAGSHSRTNSPLPPPRPPSANSSRPPRSQPSQSSLVPPKVLRRPKRPRTFGDGTELDAFEDLPTDMSKESRFRVQPKDYGNRVVGGTYSSSSKVDANKGTLRRKQRRESSSGAPTPTAFASTTNLRAAPKPEPVFKSSPQKKKKVNANHTRRKPALISGLGVTTGEKVVGNMKWNPHSLRWEGNEQVLRDFDAAVGTSSRPALITHLTGSSIGSPAGTFASGARIVGNMMFDPAQMCWISTLPPDEEEPDVFANLADDEDDDDSWAKQAGTIRASIHTTTSSTGAEDTLSRSPNSSTSSSSVAAQARSRAVSVSGSDRGSRASLAFDIDEDFVKACRVAAVRHRQEMKGWRNTLNKHTPLQHSSADSAERTSLYEIRAIARRNYED